MFEDLPPPAETWLETFFNVMVYFADSAGADHLLELFGGNLIAALSCLMAVAGVFIYGARRMVRANRFGLAVLLVYFAEEGLCTAAVMVALSSSTKLTPGFAGMIAVPIILPVVAMSFATAGQIRNRKRLAVAV
jgi:hypothetical protein